MTVNDRIKLAEAMGLRYFEKGPKPFFRYTMWWSAERAVLTRNLKFDPFKDANDCEALIKYLNEQGWEIEIDFNTNIQGVVLYHQVKMNQHYSGDNWKQGVCELALKVIE